MSAVIGPRFVVAFKRFDRAPTVGALDCVMDREAAYWTADVLNELDPPNTYCAVHEFSLDEWKEALR